MSEFLKPYRVDNDNPSFVGDDEKHLGISRTESSLTQVDLKILENQTQFDKNETSSSVSGVPVGNFFGNSQGHLLAKKKCGPFKRQASGMLNVLNNQSKRNRLVSKHGKINTFRRNKEIRGFHRYLKDFFTSFIDISWYWTLTFFAASFFLSWLMFGVLWYLIALIHGDLASQEQGEDHVPCVDNIKDFTSCFLFSLETQHTIGYGGRATTEQCSVAILVMGVQSILGVIIQACMAGIVFAKFMKPTGRGGTIIFSKNALICLRDGALHLVVRLGDLRPTHLLESHVSGHFLAKRVTQEGEVVPYHLEHMAFSSSMLESCQDYMQLFWPLVVSHKIDSASPLFKLGPSQLRDAQFEVIVTLEGTTPETGNSIQVRTSYLPGEIMWGQRFEHTTVAYDKSEYKYAVCYTTINSFAPDNTPRCSAEQLEEQEE